MKFPYRLRLEKRERTRKLDQLLIPLLSILVAFLLCGIVIQGQGYNLIEVYGRLLKGGFGSWGKLAASVLQAIPLMLCGLGVSVAFKMSVSNIGAEGQMAMGAFAAAGVAIFGVELLPPGLILPSMVLLGFLAGAAWAIVAVLPRAFLGVSETIITLLFNYIALLWVDYLCYGPWRDTAGSNMPYSKTFGAEARFSTLGSTPIHSGIFIAVAAAVLIYLFYRYTVRGYQMRVIGANVKAARYAGLDIRGKLIFAMLLSGGLAGIAGATYVGGVVYRLQPDIANNAGYIAISVAFLARFNPFAVLVVAVLFGGLSQGGYSLQILGLSSSLSTMLQGAILLCVLGGELFLRRKMVLVKTGSRGQAPPPAGKEAAAQEVEP